MHTPAPWTADPDGLITAGPRRLHIAQCATTGMGHAAQANARLIAAAPAMLDALRTIANICLMSDSNWSRTIEREALETIAKTTGE